MKTIDYKNYSDKDRLFFVGDLHGDYKLFREAYKFLQLGDKDQLISVGDLIDRGSQNIECLTHFLHANNCDSVLGNHDQFMVKALNSMKMSDWGLWFQNGGYWAESYPRPLLRGLAEAVINKFPLLMLISYKGTEVAVSHAEIPGTCIKTLRKQLAPITENIRDANGLDRLVQQRLLKEEFIWGRNIIKMPEKDVLPVEGVDLTVHGHSVTFGFREDEQPLPVQLANRHYIDTGAIFKGGRLTFAELVEGELQYTQFWYDENKELCIL